MTTNEPTTGQWAAPVPGTSVPQGPPAAWPAPPAPPGAPGAAAAPPTYGPPPVAVTQPITFRSWQPGIMALRPLPFGDFLTVPFKAMRFNRAAIVGGPLLVFSLASILTAGAIWLAFTDDKLQLTSFYSAYDDIETITVVGIAVAVLAWIVADVFASAIVIPAVARAVLGQKLPVGEALRVLAARFWHLALFGLIVSVLGGVVMLVMLLPLLGSFGAAEPSDAAVGGMLLLFVIIGIPAGVVYSVYVPVARAAIVLEKVGPIKGIARAFRLVPGRFWWTFLIIFVVGIINGVIQQVFSYATQFIAIAAMALSPDLGAGFVVALVLATLLQTLATVVVQYSFVGSVLALIYLDLRIRKEGLAFELARAAEARHAASAAGVA